MTNVLVAPGEATRHSELPAPLDLDSFRQEDTRWRPTNPSYFTAARYYTRFLSANRTSDLPLLGDSNWAGAWPENNDSVNADLQNGVTYDSGTSTQLGRYCIDRHRKAINVAFADGSARRVPLAELWLLCWHRSSVPKVVSIP